MLTINTTFFVSNAHLEAFLNWINNKYIPKMLDTPHFMTFRLYKIVAEQEPDATSFSLQFVFTEKEHCEHWHEAYQPALQSELKSVFNENVLSFSTLLEEIIE